MAEKGYVIDYAHDENGLLIRTEKLRDAMRNCKSAIENFKPLKELGKVLPAERTRNEEANRP
jgi:hypothetical protein